MIYIPVSPSKIETIESAIAAYKATGQLMVGMFNGSLAIPGSADEIGLYYFIPLVATGLNLTGAQALAVFQWAVLLVATAIGIMISLRLFRGREPRLFAIMGMLGIATLAFGLGDVYMLAPLFVAAVVPATLYMMTHPDENRLLLTLTTIGFLASIANFVSQFAAAAGLTFVLGLIAASKRSRKTRWWLAASVAAGYLMASAITQVSVSRRDALLRGADTSYEAPGRTQGVWVKTYLGLGFLTNPYVPAYRNDVAQGKLMELAPGTTLEMPAADRILRAEALAIAGAHPWFIVRTIAAKLGVIFIYLFIFVMAAQLARVRRTAGDSAGRVFALAGTIAILPAVFWVPTVENVAPAIALAVIYATHTIARARDHAPLS